jgi:DNA invertase Pin-like site-specific DNA recombinase
MRQRRIAVHCINHGADIIYGKLSDIFLMILAPLAQIEPFLPGKRARAIKQKARVEGRYLGGKTPIGFQIGQNGRLVSDGSFKDITRQVLRLKAKGLSLRMIALTLQNKGIKISHTAVDRILKSLGYRHKKEPYL